MSEPIQLEMSPQQVRESITAGEKFCIIDVREPWEFQTAAIAGSNLVPMGEVPTRIQELEAQADTSPLLVICHHGVRSLNVVHWLRQQGLENCTSLTGGIDQWSRDVDTSVPRY
jgi:rhodanese-related sulfurtransferase